MSKNNFYLTTPIYYVNDVPHIGHAYTSIAADVLARFHKQQGKEVFLLTGTDEHGAKIEEAACKAKKKPKEFVDGLIPRFKETLEAVNVQYDEFIRTTNPQHEKIVQKFVQKLQDKGFVEKRMYEGLYCISCEKYYAPEELVEGKCPDHKREPIIQKEENYFFLLSRFQEELYGKIKSDEIKIRPQSRKNEVLGKIKNGLEDISISRQNVEWGVKFPEDDSQTVYVWVDALINYYSATKIYKDGPEWPADLHIVGKDILWFHAVIWPALLLAIEEKLPKEIFAHGYFTIGGEKMSKTLGNTLDPIALSEKFGADALRYALLKEFPFGEDGDISEEKIAERYNKDLGNELGNLLQRTLMMIQKYEVKTSVLIPTEIFVEEEIGELRFDLALEQIWSVVRVLNATIEKEKPWELAKTGTTKLQELLTDILEELAGVAQALNPFMPETADKMKQQLKTLKPEPLFPRLEE